MRLSGLLLLICYYLYLLFYPGAFGKFQFTPGAGTYIGRFHYAGYTSGAFVSFPQHILNNYEISANTFNIPGYAGEFSVDEVFLYANGVMFSHTFESFEIEYSGRSCTIDSVTFTPKS